MIGGDFNKRNIKKELKVYSDLKLANTPPTRGDNTLDLIFTIFEQYIVRAGVTESICNQNNIESDHLTVYINAKVPRVPDYVVEKYTYGRQNKEGDTKLTEVLKNSNWTCLR